MKKLILILLLLPSLLFGQSQGGIIIVGGVAVHQPDTSAYKVINTIQAEGTALSGNNRFYVTYLVASAKVTGLWSASKAFYGFIGGTASSHKWNWKDMRDLDAAYRLTFPNGMTHDSFGITGNGTNQYANTFLIPSTTSGLLSSSNHLSAYVTKNIGDGNARYLFGAGAFVGSNTLGMYIRQTTIQAYLASNTTTIDAKVYTNNITDLRGHYIGNNLSNILSIKRNGAELPNNTSNLNDSFSGLPNVSMVIMARQTSAGNFSEYDNKSLGIATIGSGLTDQTAIIASPRVTFAQGIIIRK